MIKKYSVLFELRDQDSLIDSNSINFYVTDLEDLERQMIYYFRDMQDQIKGSYVEIIGITECQRRIDNRVRTAIQQIGCSFED